MKATKVNIPKPSHFSFQEICWFLDRGYDDCLHVVDSERILKAIDVEGTGLAFEISENGRSLQLDIKTNTPSLIDKAIAFTKRWLDLDRDLHPFYQIEHTLARLLQQKYFGLRLVGIPSFFEALCWSIIGQQINLTFAYRLKRRFVEHYGRSLEVDGYTLHLFPKPHTISSLSIEDLKAIQFSRQKADYIIYLAQRLESGLLHEDMIWQLDSTSTMSAELQSLRGVGEWTANYVLMKTFGRMDSVPYGDAGLINGIQKLLDLPTKPSRLEVQEVLKGTKGWDAYLVYYIWRSLSEPPKLVGDR